jgi:P-aminobenzoate N-oxygenase AurF
VDTLVETADQLHRASVRGYINPYDHIQWPQAVEIEQWFTRPELVSIHGTEAWESLDEAARKRLSFFEAVNFFSLNIFGERQQMEGLARRLYDPDKRAITPYLHNFLDEENKHNVFFGTFCLRYGGKVYAHPKLSLPREYAPGEEDLLFFAKILIFEEIADRHNVAMGKDSRLVPVARQINQVHHMEEARHLRFGRAVVRDLWTRHSPTWPRETVENVSEHLRDYLEATWLEYFNPAVYRDAELADAFALRQLALEHPAVKARRRALSERCVRFLCETGIFPDEPVT